jgi:hypothetical protein
MPKSNTTTATMEFSLLRNTAKSVWIKGNLSPFLALEGNIKMLGPSVLFKKIMYMACCFMVHSSLHWTDQGSDDISLWPFAVKHAVWLYNHVPNHLSGLTPLELLMKSKADHPDILRSHVWGCPAIVLDPNLQNDQKLLKWNRHARVGQFWGVLG